MMVDYIVLCVVAVFAVFGLIRGIVSQIMALAGLAAAFVFAPMGGKELGGFIQHELGCSRFMAEKAGIFALGVGIYLLARLLGYGIDRLLIRRVSAFKRLNRLGGALLGGLKGVVFVGVFFSFLTLFPRAMVRGWAPKVVESRTYRLVAEYNPMGRQQVIEPMRGIRALVQNPARREKFIRDPELEAVLKRHRLQGAFRDEKFLKSLEDGDFEKLQGTENVEKLMKDEDLTRLLGRLSEKN